MPVAAGPPTDERLHRPHCIDHPNEAQDDHPRLVCRIDGGEKS